MKTALEQARDALEIAREAMMERRAYCEQWEYKYGREWDEEDAAIKEALAAIDAEKPAEDAERVVDEIGRSLIHNVSYGCGGRDCIDSSVAVPIIQQFAETYHSARCKECKALPNAE